MVNRVHNTGGSEEFDSQLGSPELAADPLQSSTPEADMTQRAAEYRQEAKKLIVERVIHEVIEDPSTKELPKTVIRTIIITRCRKLFALVFGSQNAASENAA